MNQYFNPDINNLREVPETVRNDVFGLADEAPQSAAPDLQFVEHMLSMIRFARDTRPVQASY
jgi:hypothetical protein